ncbi:MAG TPA: hypothetical protein PLW86_01435 [Rhodocyclaceae bacterium]|nr:hypothetical protein [Rhodocyclaceae bacterium]
MRAFLSLFWLISLFHALRRSELCLKALHLSADGRCSVVRNLGEAPEPSALLPGLYVHPWLTVLRLQTGDGAVIPVVVLPDVMAADDRRHLRLWLRHKAKIGEDGDV